MQMPSFKTWLRWAFALLTSLVILFLGLNPPEMPRLESPVQAFEDEN